MSQKVVLAASVVLLLCASPGAAKSKTASAVAAANAAKADFHARNAPSSRVPSRGAIANRTLEVVVNAVLADGRLALEDLRGRPIGTLDPLTIPELIAQERSRFGGRRHLLPADLRAGQRLRLVFAGSTSEILRAKVLKDRRKPPAG